MLNPVGGQFRQEAVGGVFQPIHLLIEPGVFAGFHNAPVDAGNDGAHNEGGDDGRFKMFHNFQWV